ncbi:carbohydrate-binding protein [Flavobacterium akiainvivens]|uniref:Carbohydrate-binding protein n=1 Tax=Flavobacterium akiainvivens TaxID=1202724 RepID=A0A0M8MGN0_9FLAO|nr:T9SS type A sorting domain-containing protein [Flavobacterium akiainvivens]KOS05851.1 carbohydrate-binding protein [Flavobacterium akiainvivens]SFQ56787.1 alpha-galactosidase [Flavobacterium akiainvivens]
MYVKKITVNSLINRSMLAMAAALFTGGAFAQTYEAEAGTLTGDANIQSCDACSGSIVGNLSSSSTVTIAVNVANAGWYNMQTFYATGDPRTFSITPGTGNTLIVPVSASGGWSTAASINISIYLNAGSTNITFGSPSWGPNLDKIVLSAVTASQLQVIDFGANNQVQYNLTAKTYNVVMDGVTVITGASATANGNQNNVSTGYTNAAHTSEAFTDEIGSGTKHVITLSGGYTNNMEQTFYTYTGKDYLVVQVALTGAGANCYRMSPLTSYNVSPDFAGGDTRALNVPYDNDAWIRYSANVLATTEFTGAEVTNLYSNDSRHGLVLGSIDNSRWKSGVSVQGGSAGSAYVSVFNGFAQQSVTRDTRGHGWVNIGLDYCPSTKVAIIANDDWRTAFETYGELSALMQPKYIADWTAAKPMGWNSWGVIQTNLNLTKAKGVVDFFHDNVPAFRTEDNTLYIDLDSYWDNMTDAQLAEFVQYAESKGMQAGIYWAPFVDWGMFARPIEGSSYNYQQTWTKVNNNPFTMSGAYAMDPTHPATQMRIDHFIERFKVAGFTMIKLDFLDHAGIEADSFYDWQVHTGMEAYHVGMKYLIDAIGDDMLVEASICPNNATGPYAHMRRIACDAYAGIGDTEYTLNSTTYGWWQNKMYDFMDADNVVIGTQPINVNRARYASSIVTGTITVGDDYSADGPWINTAESMLQNPDLLVLAKADAGFRPADGNTGNTASRVFYTTIGDNTYVAVFNYAGAAADTNIPLERVGLNTSITYNVKEFFGGETSTASGAMSFNMPGSDARIYRLRDSSLSVDTPVLETSGYVFPNPANDNLTIKFANAVNGEATVTITDITGKQVWAQNMQIDGTMSPQIPVSSLTKGLYIVSVKNGKDSQNYKFIKQ